METRRFGTTDLETSAVGFGTWALGSDWWGDHEDPDRLIARALELGITFFDTGDTYGQGLNEELVGAALAKSGTPREKIQLSTKFGYLLDSERTDHGESERPHDWSPAHTRGALEASLKRLRTDYLDLYQLHNPRIDAIDHDDLFACLEQLKAEGKIRHYGVALGPKIGWRDEGLEALRRRPIASLQTVYNMLEQEPGAEFLEVGEAAGVGIIARVPTSSGLLEGQLTADHTFDGNDHRRHRPRSWLIDGLKKVDQLDFLTRDGERTLAQVAYRFILSQPAIATVVHTVNTCAQLDEWGRATDVPPLDDDELAAFDELYRSGFGLLEPAARASGGSPGRSAAA
jgi:aryl-alcohol dehydrogenase-like predicted oxidoreductase